MIVKKYSKFLKKNKKNLQSNSNRREGLKRYKEANREMKHK